MESLRTTRADRVQEEEEEESGDEDGEVSHREGENDSEEAKGDAKKFKVGPGQLAVLATALDSLVNKIASSIIPSLLPHRFPFPRPQFTSPFHVPRSFSPNSLTYRVNHRSILVLMCALDYEE